MMFTEYGGKEKCELLYFQVTEDRGEQDAITDEVNFLTRILTQNKDMGGARDKDGNLLRKSDGIFVQRLYSQDYHDRSPILKKCNEVIQGFQNFCLPIFGDQYGVFGKNLGNFTFGAAFNAYGDGDEYKVHRDASDVTILWFPKQGQYEGGQLILPDWNLKVDVHSFHGVVFPSFYRHYVLPVKTESEFPERFSVSTFVYGER